MIKVINNLEDAVFYFANHYSLNDIDKIAKERKITPIEFVLNFFDPAASPEGRIMEKIDYTLNWLFLSTSGVHGHYGTLDDIDVNFKWDGKQFIARTDEDEINPSVTVLILCPRTVSVYYGTIEITHPDQIKRLREIATLTQSGIKETQMGNILDNQTYPDKEVD